MTIIMSASRKLNNNAANMLFTIIDYPVLCLHVKELIYCIRGETEKVVSYSWGDRVGIRE